MAAILAEREARSAHAAKLYNEALSLDADIEAARKELDTVRARLNFFSAERQSLGFVRPVAAALPPETAYGMGRKKLLLAALLRRCCCGGRATAIDMVDGRVRAVGDAERAMNMPALGWHVEGDVEAARLFADDQLRRMAGALTRERTAMHAGVRLSGVKPGAGTVGCAGSSRAPSTASATDAGGGGQRLQPGCALWQHAAGLAECLREDAAARSASSRRRRTAGAGARRRRRRSPGPRRPPGAPLLDDWRQSTPSCWSTRRRCCWRPTPRSCSTASVTRCSSSRPMRRRAARSSRAPGARGERRAGGRPDRQPRARARRRRLLAPPVGRVPDAPQVRRVRLAAGLAPAAGGVAGTRPAACGRTEAKGATA